MFMRPTFLRTAIASPRVVSQPWHPHPPLCRLQPAGRVGIPRAQPSHPRFLTGQSGPPTPGNDAPNPVDDAKDAHQEESEDRSQKWKGTAFKMFESAATTGASIFILGLVGYSYTLYYKYMVLEKMENAFEPGDPVLELAASGKEVPLEDQRGTTLGDIHSAGEDYDRWIPREEQERINKIMRGDEKGRYHLLIGEKGTGKSSMLIEAMSKINGEGVAMMEAHADPEIFRIRLGRCLDFEFHEDNIGALFSIRGPRDASALLDIERAFNKLEKVALKRRVKIGRPLILIINQVHLIRDDEDGRDLIELIQQRAEQWAASNLATVIMNSDKYWVYETLKQHATRMEVTQVSDLPKDRAMQALRNYRMKYWKEITPRTILEEVYDKIGGRLTFLNRVAKSQDMVKKCDEICQMEKTWFLNNCAILGEEMDDDVMDQQKYAVGGIRFLELEHALTKPPVHRHGPRQRPLPAIRRHGRKVRSRPRPYPPGIPPPSSTLHHDALRLHPPTPQSLHLRHRLTRHGPCRQRAHAARFQRSLCRTGLREVLGSYARAHCRYRVAWSYKGTHVQGSMGWRQVQDYDSGSEGGG